MLRSVIATKTKDIDSPGLFSDTHTPELLAPKATISPPSRPWARLRIDGKFLQAGSSRFHVRGVTYGPFRPDESGCEYHTPDRVEHDCAAMAAAGFNAFRTYTIPPRWLLEIAWRYGLRVMIGLPWEQHVTFLDSRRMRRDIETRVRRAATAVAGHPAVLCIAVGNEIPESIVRWYGRRKIERWIEHLYNTVKSEDSDALVTYVNLPTTEYLELPFLDLIGFNVYLESESRLRSYIARLQNRTDHRPLLMAEIGLDSFRNGEAAQAATLEWQIRAAFAEGACGSFVFSWTDEWHRGGFDIDDWGFGITDRYRRPKPALRAVKKAFANAPVPAGIDWPRVSVVVCTYNGSCTIAETCRHLLALDYPDYEVIVVDDGSTDNVPAVLDTFHGIRVIRQENAGLSAARNVGLAAASGDIIAYIDDDAYPDRTWLHFLVWTLLETDHAAVGGPNLPPPDDPWIAQCIGRSPGCAQHVLLDDRQAEHIPGCNMAFRKSALNAIGGFDERYRIAGDDVDVCWRLQKAGGTIGFHNAALVWHHPRNSVRAYLRQQFNYGRAEEILERQWPQKYNGNGYTTWAGRIYGPGGETSLTKRSQVYHGVWGSAAFQGLYTQPAGLLYALPLMPEWYALVGILALIAAGGLLWSPLLAALPLLALALLLPGIRAWTCAQATMRGFKGTARWKFCAVVAAMHIVQPLARLKGRCSYGPWRPKLRITRFKLPGARQLRIWSETWRAPEERLESLERELAHSASHVCRGGSFDRWDIGVCEAPIGGVRLLMAIEEHGAGQQLVRLRIRPHPGGVPIATAGLFAVVALASLAGAQPVAAGVFGLLAAGVTLAAIIGCGAATARAVEAVERLKKSEEHET